MAVYVDDMEADYGRMKMCHCVADSTEELLAMMDKIGVNRRWIQDEGTYREHFDIALSKKKQALAHGAIAVSQHELGRMIAARRDGWPMSATKPTNAKLPF